MYGDQLHCSREVACTPRVLHPLASCPCCGLAAGGLVHPRGMKGISGGLEAALTGGKLRTLQAPLVCMPRWQGDGHPSKPSCPCSPCTLGQHSDPHSPHPSIHPIHLSIHAAGMPQNMPKPRERLSYPLPPLPVRRAAWQGGQHRVWESVLRQST